MSKISFGKPIEPMGPYYSEVDLNDYPISFDSQLILQELIDDAGGNLVAELKEDGFRCQVHVNGREIKLFTRGSGEFETRCFPEITTALAELNLKKTIFDSELRGTAGQYKGFKAVQARARYKGKVSEKRLAEYLRSKPKEFPLQLSVFDLLMNRGKSRIKEINSNRRLELEDLLGDNKTIAPVSRTLVETPSEIVDLYQKKVVKEGYEGLVLKQPRLEYLLGDKIHWVKLKKFEPLDLVVLGLVKRENVDFTQALVGSYHLERKMYQALGWVNLVRENSATGNLFSKDVVKLVGKKLNSKPESVEVGKKIPEIYVSPKVVLEIRAMNIDPGTDYACSVDGKAFYSLRIAYVKSIREDKRAEQATTTQFIARHYQKQK